MQHVTRPSSRDVLEHNIGHFKSCHKSEASFYLKSQLFLSTGQTCTGGWRLFPTPPTQKEKKKKWYMRTGVRMHTKWYYSMWFCAFHTHPQILMFIHFFACMSDCPQVQCVEQYIAQQADELTLEPTEIINVLRKTNEGKNVEGNPEEKVIFLCGRLSRRWAGLEI